MILPLVLATVFVLPPGEQDASALMQAGISYVDLHRVTCNGAVEVIPGEPRTARCIGTWQKQATVGRETFQPRDKVQFTVDLPLGVSYWAATYIWNEPVTDEFGVTTLQQRERESGLDPVLKVSSELEVKSPTLRIESSPCSGAVCVRITTGG